MAIGEYRHVVKFQVPTSVPDGDGGYIDGWADLDPPWAVQIRPATVRDLERTTAGTIVASATHVISGRYRADAASLIDAQMLFDGRTFRIAGVANVDERKITMHLFAVETL
jgi:SPP1 family predicted phage head-tail adaptor